MPNASRKASRRADAWCLNVERPRAHDVGVDRGCEAGTEPGADGGLPDAARVPASVPKTRIRRQPLQIPLTDTRRTDMRSARATQIPTDSPSDTRSHRPNPPTRPKPLSDRPAASSRHPRHPRHTSSPPDSPRPGHGPVTRTTQASSLDVRAPRGDPRAGAPASRSALGHHMHDVHAGSEPALVPSAVAAALQPNTCTSNTEGRVPLWCRKDADAAGASILSRLSLSRPFPSIVDREASLVDMLRNGLQSNSLEVAEHIRKRGSATTATWLLLRDVGAMLPRKSDNSTRGGAPSPRYDAGGSLRPRHQTFWQRYLFGLSVSTWVFSSGTHEENFEGKAGDGPRLARGDRRLVNWARSARNPRRRPPTDPGRGCPGAPQHSCTNPEGSAALAQPPLAPAS
ncbi:hypothetical protein WOLCODRAFT_165598 [Wolfiporia cocos MD-104 SS10]|uniref:Uncharacterized protein n=1 Tax=Wolfiporia cocos (strain MD-104) TaxID=742152 RepID=A0A2H3JU48_WOLCO|nr:hypothetical protein WOLCODRAFT_165598 [Wolfiporia cocos MD-104 SS10]